MQAPYRRPTRPVRIGDLTIGGSNPITIQSMTNTDTRDVTATVSQIHQLTEAGCEIIRVAVPDAEAAEAVREIKKQITIPLAVDIHFDYRLALLSLENGADKLRINPGNIGDRTHTEKVVKKAKERGIPIRIGVNGGSLEKDLLLKYGGVTAEALAESAIKHIHILEELDFTNTVVALKSSSVPVTCRAYSIIAEQTDYPLHVGITEAGTCYNGIIKSAAGIGSLLLSGIGDTIRVSLTADPLEEIKCALELLKALEIRNSGVQFVSCPTCGRTEIDLIGLAEAVEKRCVGIKKDIKVAVMGCAVNGPGEAREADIGIAGGSGCGLIFKKGMIIRKVSEDELLESLLDEIEKL